MICGKISGAKYVACTLGVAIRVITIFFGGIVTKIGTSGTSGTTGTSFRSIMAGINFAIKVLFFCLFSIFSRLTFLKTI